MLAGLGPREGMCSTFLVCFLARHPGTACPGREPAVHDMTSVMVHVRKCRTMMARKPIASASSPSDVLSRFLSALIEQFRSVCTALCARIDAVPQVANVIWE